MSELGACPKCHKRLGFRVQDSVYYQSGMRASVIPVVCCLDCGHLRPDLIRKDDRIEKRDDDQNN